jgi:hypothetical protein
MDISAKYNDFIGMYENVYPDYFCQHLIDEFERLNSTGFCGNRQDSEGIGKSKKQDEFCFLNMKNHVMSPFQENNTERMFLDGLQACFDDYVKEYDVLLNANLKCTSIKMQKTSPGGGYHIWHCEQGNNESANRGLVYSLYLNNLDDNCAGETEFLYQKLRIPPKENSMVIWPASFSHTHRGNVVHGDKAKYIVTGWFYYE